MSHEPERKANRRRVVALDSGNESAPRFLDRIGPGLSHPLLGLEVGFYLGVTQAVHPDSNRFDRNILKVISLSADRHCSMDHVLATPELLQGGSGLLKIGRFSQHLGTHRNQSVAAENQTVRVALRAGPRLTQREPLRLLLSRTLLVDLFLKRRRNDFEG